MASSTFVALLCLLGLGLVQAQAAPNHACCVSTYSWEAGQTGCIRDECSKAMVAMNTNTSQSLSTVNEFFDACSIANKKEIMFAVATCAANYLNRAAYSDLVMEYSQIQQTSAGREAARRSLNIAALILGISCTRNQTSACARAINNVFTTPSSSVRSFNLSNADRSTVVTFSSINNLVRPCLSDTSGTFSTSTFNNGPAQCAAVGLDTHPARITDYVHHVATSCDNLPECTVPRNEPLFCANYFSSTAGRRSAVRCEAPVSADRIARSFHSQWRRNRSARFGNVVVTVNNNICSASLAEVACEAVMGVCHNQRRTTAGCRYTCEDIFTQQCGANITVAREACAALGATVVSEDCPSQASSSPTQATADAVLADLDRTATLVETSEMGSAFTIGIGMEVQARDNDTLLTVAQNQAIDSCSEVTESTCELVSSQVVPPTGNATSAYSFKMNSKTTSNSTSNIAAQVKSNINNALKSQVDVQVVPAPLMQVLASTGGGSSLSTSVLSVMLAAVALAVFHM